MDALRIAMVIPPWFDLPPKGYGGTENVVALLVDELCTRGHDVHVIGAGDNNTKGTMHNTYSEAQGDRITYAVPEIVHAAMANAYIQQYGFDIVHDHSTAGPLTAGGRTIPTIVTTHSHVTDERGWYYKHLGTSVELVAISAAQRATNPMLHWRDVVHNAIEVEDFPFQSQKEEWVLFLGRTVPDKGMAQAIIAARAAGRHLRIAAKCTELKEQIYFRDVIQSMIRGRSDVEWLGEVTGDEKKELLREARCLLAPIQWDEPFGMVFVEAMACGTPVVAMNRGAAPEVVGDTGFVCNTAEELPGAIARVDGLSPLECRMRVRRLFSPGRMAQDYERIYVDAVTAGAKVRRNLRGTTR